jgi:hypothetical protein
MMLKKAMHTDTQDSKEHCEKELTRKGRKHRRLHTAKWKQNIKIKSQNETEKENENGEQKQSRR